LTTNPECTPLGRGKVNSHLGRGKSIVSERDDKVRAEKRSGKGKRGRGPGKSENKKFKKLARNMSKTVKKSQIGKKGW